MHIQSDQIVPLTPRLIAERLAVPFLLFSAVLVSLLTLSWLLVLPYLTQVEIGQSVHSSTELSAYYSKVQADLMQAESEREASMVPLHQTPYRTLVDSVHSEPLVSDLLDIISQEAAQLVPGRSDIVQVASFSYERENRSLVLTGDVRGIGPRSMTVLARFIDGLDRHTRLSVVDRPQLRRADDPHIGFHSPFEITLLVL